MYGALIVDPRGGRPPANEFVLVQSEFYLSGPQGADSVRAMDWDKVLNLAPDYVAFNGVSARYATKPIPVGVGAPIRMFVVNAGPNRVSAFHVVGGIFDRMATFFSLVGASAPDFWLAIVAIVIFAVNLHWLPTSGTGSVAHWILPVSVLFIRPFGLILQVVRGSMINVLSSAYVKTARAKGVRSRSIIFVHGLRNAMLPVITVIGDQAASILNGAVVVETVFGFPGIGKLMIDSILLRDFAVVLAVIMVSALAIFIMNLLIDLAYALLDPRIRY